MPDVIRLELKIFVMCESRVTYSEIYERFKRPNRRKPTCQRQALFNVNGFNYCTIHAGMRLLELALGEKENA